MKIINNLGNKNHFIAIRDAFAEADEVLLVSPFLAEKMGTLLAKFPSPRLQKLTLVTQLEGYSIDQLSKVDSLVSIFDYITGLKPSQPELVIQLNEDLHGKVYLFFRKNSPFLGIVGSANFTNPGLSENHEWGIAIEDSAVLVELRSQVLPKSAPLTKDDLNRLVKARNIFLKQQPQIAERGVNRIKLNLNDVLAKASKARMPRREEAVKCYVVNTNSSNDESEWMDAWKYMLTKDRASAFYGKKEKMDNIQKGNRILLFHKKVGFIACGTARAGHQEADYRGDECNEHYVPVNWVAKVHPYKSPEKAVRYGEVTAYLKTVSSPLTKLSVTQACQEIREEIACLEIPRFIEEKLKERTAK